MRPLALVAGEIRRRELDLALWYLQVLGRILLRRDDDREALLLPGAELRRHLQFRPRLRSERDADERDPAVVFPHDEHAVAAEPRARRLLAGAEGDSRDAARHRRRARDGRRPRPRRPRWRSEPKRAKETTPIDTR